MHFAYERSLSQEATFYYLFIHYSHAIHRSWRGKHCPDFPSAVQAACCKFPFTLRPGLVPRKSRCAPRKSQRKPQPHPYSSPADAMKKARGETTVDLPLASSYSASTLRSSPLPLAPTPTPRSPRLPQSKPAFLHPWWKRKSSTG